MKFLIPFWFIEKKKIPRENWVSSDFYVQAPAMINVTSQSTLKSIFDVLTSAANLSLVKSSKVCGFYIAKS